MSTFPVLYVSTSGFQVARVRLTLLKSCFEFFRISVAYRSTVKIDQCSHRMRLKLVFSTFISVSHAQSPFFSMSKEWVLGIYSSILESQADSELATIFARGIQSKADSDGVPEHIHDSVMQAFVGQTRNSNNCPNGGCSVPLDMNQIWNYGCWCNFDDNLTTGKGVPVDQFDHVCQRMQLCLRCAEFDTNHCTARNTSYTAGMSLQAMDIVSDCDSQNNGDVCKTHLCACEGQFVADIIDLLWTNTGGTNNSFKHESGFDVESECVVISQGGNGGGPGNTANQVQVENNCCGLYPRRVPYNVNMHGCCSDGTTYGKLFNPYTQYCCDDIMVVDGPTC